MPRTPVPTTALYVRLPAAEADKLDRAARAMGVPKKVLVTGLVSALADPDGGHGAPGAGAPAMARGAVESGGGSMPVGAYSFHPHELPEVLTPAQAAQLLQLSEPVVVQLAESGQIPGRVLGGTWRFSRAALVAWLSSGRNEPGH